MFTGIVEDIGLVCSIRRSPTEAKVTIRSEKISRDLSLGDSIAVNGICLTVSAFRGDMFTADVMNETWNRTSLRMMRVGGTVNLERAMPAQGRFGGHIVSGHIDGTGKIVRIRKDQNALWYYVQCAPEILEFIVEKGSITVDGISLTVALLEKDRFAVSLIPHTLKETILQFKRAGDLVNLETDMIGKYVKKWMEKGETSPISKEFLQAHNF